jgi:hypothetical protein
MALLSSKPVTRAEQEEINRIRRMMREEDDTVKLSLLLRQLKELLDRRKLEIADNGMGRDPGSTFFRAA